MRSWPPPRVPQAGLPPPAGGPRGPEYSAAGTRKPASLPYCLGTWCESPRALGLASSVTRTSVTRATSGPLHPSLCLGTPQGQAPLGLSSGRARSGGQGAGASLSNAVLSPATPSSARSSPSTRAGRCRYWPWEGQGGGAGGGCRELLIFLRPSCRQLDQTGQHLFCICGTRVNILDVASGAVLRSLEQVRVGRARAMG